MAKKKRRAVSKAVRAKQSAKRAKERAKQIAWRKAAKVRWQVYVKRHNAAIKGIEKREVSKVKKDLKRTSKKLDFSPEMVERLDRFVDSRVKEWKERAEKAEKQLAQLAPFIQSYQTIEQVTREKLLEAEMSGEDMYEAIKRIAEEEGRDVRDVYTDWIYLSAA